LVPATAVTTEGNNITHSGPIRFDGDTRVISEENAKISAQLKIANLTQVTGNSTNRTGMITLSVHPKPRNGCVTQMFRHATAASQIPIIKVDRLVLLQQAMLPIGYMQIT